MTQLADRAVQQIPGIDRAGTVVAGSVHKAVLRGGPVTRHIADFLHGTWLGHPLHPVLTDFTIGAWLLGGAFDATARITGSPQAAWAGDRLAEIGTGFAVPTALTGLTDYSTLPHERATKPATLHAMLNGVSFGLYIASVWQRRRGNHQRGCALSWTAQTLTLASAWLGGTLVYKHNVGTDHSERFTEPRAWTAVLDEHALPERTPKRVDLDGKGVLLYREDGRVYAIGSVCAHAGGPLEQGRFSDHCVQCPWHDSVFDYRTGEIVHGPATHPQQRFETRVRDGRIELRIAAHAPTPRPREAAEPWRGRLREAADYPER